MFSKCDENEDFEQKKNTPTFLLPLYYASEILRGSLCETLNPKMCILD